MPERGTTRCIPLPYAMADINKDGRVDIADVIFLLAGLNEDPSDKTVNITEAKGWLESVYAKWELVDGAANYNVYIKGGASLVQA